jgi:hypothetical protein
LPTDQARVNRGKFLVAELKPTFSPVDRVSKDLRHNPFAARIPMSALLGLDTQLQIKDSAFNRIFKAEKKRHRSSGNVDISTPAD